LAGHISDHVQRGTPPSRQSLATEEFGFRRDAIERERQLKRWSAQKKAALVAGEIKTLRNLSKRRRPRPETIRGRAPGSSIE
jgi:predicted GIY-YIG superfamily endonuclease